MAKLKDNGKIFAPLKEKDLVRTPEEEVRQEFIRILHENFNYPYELMEQEVRVSNSKRGHGNARADIVVWRTAKDKKESNSPLFVVECKAETITVREEDYYQGSNYASWAGADFFITTNQKETKIFNVIKGKIPKGLEELARIPKFAETKSDKDLDKVKTETKVFSRDEFSKLLFKCHNIIRNNDKLSPEAAFDEISKILFMKIRFERNQARERGLFSEDEFNTLKASYMKTAHAGSMPFYQNLFELTKQEFVNDEIFETTDSIKIRENSFLQIVRELQVYNLSNTSDDVKGIAFEQFLGRTFRGELGQFFTPRKIVEYMVKVLDPQEGERVCDPCCGSGGFLIAAFEHVRERIEKNIQIAKEKIKTETFNSDFDALNEKQQLEIIRKVEVKFNKLNQELNLANGFGRLRKLSYDCIFGTDANPRMARTAKMNMIMHGDGHGGVHHHDGLLNVNGIFDGRFDVILTNPPFGARVGAEQKVLPNDLPDERKIKYWTERYMEGYEATVINPLRDWAKKGTKLLDLFDVGKLSGLTEVLFIERCLRLLKPGGRMGIVLPEGVLNNSALQKVREYVEGKAKLINITSIPQDVFIASGATVKPSLVFLKKFTEDESEQYNKIVGHSQNETAVKYEPEIYKLKAEYDKLEFEAKESKNKIELKHIRKERAEKEKRLQGIMDDEIRAIVKQNFNYEIPVIEVQFAGISSTGAEIENQLVEVEKEFRAYREQSKMWKALDSHADYVSAKGEDLKRIWVVDGVVQEAEEFYGK